METLSKQKTKKEEVLESLDFTKNAVVRVMPIIRKSDWLPQNHDGEFLNQGAKIDIVVPYNINRDHLIDPLPHLSKSQKTTLAKKLGLSDSEDLNPLKEEKNYWKNRAVRLKREGLILHTEDPYDYVRICILLSDTEHVAPSWSSRSDKFTYRFAIVQSSEENKEGEIQVDLNVQAYNLFADVMSDLKALEAILWIRYYEKNTYPKPPVQLDFRWAKLEIEKMVKDQPKDFVNLVGEESFKTKHLVYKGLKYGILVKEGQQIRFNSSASAIGLFSDTVAYLDAEKHAEDKRLLQDKVEEEEKNDSKSGNK